MLPFLKQVADYYFQKGNISAKCFIFPNRRSMVFFNKYLSESMIGRDTPIIAPEMYTINDFFYKVAACSVTDRVTLLLELYKIYSDLYKNPESLDDFIFWGDIILGDFNDIDKYLADPKQLFRNVTDFKEIQDTYSYLTDTQRAAIESFIRNFKDSEGRLTVNIGSDNPDVKERFLQIWNILYPMYVKFNQALSSRGMAYEGMVYRRFAEMVSGKLTDSHQEVNLLSLDSVLKEKFRSRDGFVFVGLNALNECEKTVLRKMRDLDLAEFCWDYCGDMISDKANKSSFFMSSNVKEFPSSFQVQAPCKAKFHVLAVPSSVGQVKQVPQILNNIENPGMDCALVLPDENLLVPLLNSIPPQIQEINVTMGYPMSGSEMFSFMSVVASLQLHSIKRGEQWYFYHKQVWDFFSSAIFRKCKDNKAEEIVTKIKKEARYYIPVTDFKGSILLETIFRPVLQRPNDADVEQIQIFSEYLVNVIKMIGPKLTDDQDLALELEFAKEYYRSINMLRVMDLSVKPMTFVHLVNQLLSSVSVPFKGEPLKGLQIMGPLETRALDFSNVVIFSANEGIFPRKSVSSSFIPPELRKGFGLPTYEFQDAVWAYYFYRLITRAENVWMIYDSRTEGMNSGEESRYIKQLRYHFGVDLDLSTVKPAIMEAGAIRDIPKTQKDVDFIKERPLSASSIQHYLDCPAMFYYADIKKLKQNDQVKEVVDNGILGIIFHNTMASLYLGEAAMALDFDIDNSDMIRSIKPRKTIDRNYIESWLSRKDIIRQKIRNLVMKELSAIDLSGRNLVVVDVVLEYVLQTLRRDLEQLKLQNLQSFEILGVERYMTMDFHGQKFHGFIDRLDSFEDGKIRIVDYKTGHVYEDDEYINDRNAEKIVDKIFKQNVSERPKIALQFFIYDKLMETYLGDSYKSGEIVLQNSVYSMSKLFRQVPETIGQNMIFKAKMEEKLVAMIDEMYDLEQPFRRVEMKESQSQHSPCDYCDFKVICGR